MPESWNTLHCGTLPVKLRLCSLELVAHRKPAPNIRCTRFAALRSDQRDLLRLCGLVGGVVVLSSFTGELLVSRLE